MHNIITFLLHLLLGRLVGQIWRRDMLLPPGTSLQNRYMINKVHEQGRENAVYLAYDEVQRLDVAIKENTHSDRAHFDQFELEANLLVRLDHPNIPKGSAYFVEDHFQFFAMDYIEGINLQQLIQRRRPATYEILAWAAQLCDILTDLHSLTPPIIHNDIEPSNIILVADGRIVLVDFGFAKICQPESQTVSTTGKTRGDLVEAIDGHAVHPELPLMTDPRSDQHGLAATLYSLLTGAPRSLSREWLAEVSALPSIRSARPDLSPYAEEAIFRALSPQPGIRYRDMQEFKAALGC